MRDIDMTHRLLSAAQAIPFVPRYRQNRCLSDFVSLAGPSSDSACTAGCHRYAAVRASDHSKTTRQESTIIRHHRIGLTCEGCVPDTAAPSRQLVQVVIFTTVHVRSVGLEPRPLSADGTFAPCRRWHRIVRY